MGDILTVVGEVMLLLTVGGETMLLREPEEGRVLNGSSIGLDEMGKFPACWFLEGRVFVEEDGAGGGGGGIG